MRTQQRPSAVPGREPQEAYGIDPRSIEDDPFVPASAAPRRNAAAIPSGIAPADTVQKEMVQKDTVENDAMQESPLSATGQAPELDGQEELGPQLAWVSLDAPRGLLICKNLDMEVYEFVGTIVESRVVRVMKDKDGNVFCASSTRQIADVGRPGRACASCEDRGDCCFPRWWIAWLEEESGQVFAHTLSQTGTLNFTRYAAKLKREGLVPSQTLTRIFVEEARRQKAGTVYRRIQFERDDPFKDE